MKEVQEKQEKIRMEVTKRFLLYQHKCHLSNLTDDEIAHVINIGCSILATKWKIGPEGGSFVQAVVGNDLMGAFGRADEINKRAIYFYTMLMYNAELR